MSIRLNKVTKEFNIGLQTAVDFLQKKGFSEVEANPNYKITEEQYAQLQNEFSSDKGLRNEATQLIQQHTGDSTGTPESNQKLSEKRAQAIVDKLVELGIDPSRLTAVGKGQYAPIADNSTEEGKAKNRRVVFVAK